METATMLAQISREKKISLCGITPDQTEANFQGQLFAENWDRLKLLLVLLSKGAEAPRGIHDRRWAARVVGDIRLLQRRSLAAVYELLS